METLEAVAYVAQVIGVLAIIGTLAFGITQIRESNRLAQIDLTTRIGLGLTEFNMNLGLNPQAAEIWRTGMLDQSKLDENTRTQFTMLCTSAFNGYETQFRLHQENMLADVMFERSVRQLTFFSTLQGVRDWWPRHRANFNTDFAQFVDGIIDETSESKASKA